VTVLDSSEAGDAKGDPAVAQSAPAGPVGLSGWLILPLLGLVVTPALSIFSQWASYQDALSAWAFISGGQKAFLILETLVVIAVFVLFPVVLLFLAFQRSEMFPGLYISWICALPIVVLADGFATLWAFSDLLTSEEVFDRQTRSEIGRGVVQAIIWTLYMNRSRRVENTFVN
jgi:hypothetical protein